MTKPIKTPWGANYPNTGTRVVLTRYANGNTWNGDHRDPILTIVGVVTETPAKGSQYLTIKTDLLTPPGIRGWDPEHSEAWSIGERHVTVHVHQFWSWTVIPTDTPAPKPPARERLAQALAKQQAESGNSKLMLPLEEYWANVLTSRQREEYLVKADELLATLGDDQ